MASPAPSQAGLTTPCGTLALSQRRAGIWTRPISRQCLLCAFWSLLPEGHRNYQGLALGEPQSGGEGKNRGLAGGSQKPWDPNARKA